MTKELEEQYLKELKRTEKKLLAKGKIYATGNLQKLILDCEKRIDEYSKVKKYTLVNDEVWKPIEGFEDQYIISSSGKVIRLPHQFKGKNGVTATAAEYKLKPHEKDGFIRVRIFYGKTYVCPAVSKLVYQTFIADVPRGYVVRNRDGNIYNNNLDNLYLEKINFSHPKKIKKKVA